MTRELNKRSVESADLNISGDGANICSQGCQTENCTQGVPELMTESELGQFLRLNTVSNGDLRNAVYNLKRTRGLPCIHLCRQPLYPREAVRQWLLDQAEKGHS